MSPEVSSNTFTLPQITESLAPYIRTRQETLRIRRILTIFFAQSIDNGRANAISPTFLAVSNDKARVRLISPELTGLRKKYLKALQAHINSREDYKSQSRGLNEVNVRARRQEQRDMDNNASVAVSTQLELQREQRRYEKLRILQDYLDLLAMKDAANVDYLDTQMILKDMPPVPDLPSNIILERPSRSFPQSQDRTQELTLQLEKAILVAQYSLTKERILLEKAKNEQLNSETLKNNRPDDLKVKVQALRRTRDELVNWIEQQLAKSSQIKEAFETNEPSNLIDVPLEFSRREEEIQNKYEEYVQARRLLVDFILDRSTFGAQENPAETKESSSSQKTRGNDAEWDEARLVLPYLTEYLIPAANAHRAFLQEESQLHQNLALQNRKTAKVLDKLAHESHLLSSYPLLVNQPQLDNATTAMSARHLLSGPMEPKGEESQIVRKARAWAFAASAATSAQQGAIEDRLNHGEKHIGFAQNLVNELQDIMGTENEDNVEEDSESSGSSKSKEKRKVIGNFSKIERNKGQLGIWAGLDGDIQVKDDRYGSIP